MTLRVVSAERVDVKIGDLRYRPALGQRLIDFCDGAVTPLQFGCRAGSCGLCLVRVTSGMANLSAVTDNERILLPELSSDPQARLACQLTLHGPVALERIPAFG